MKLGLLRRLDVFGLSLPTRERELKPTTYKELASKRKSLPTRERELKLLRLAALPPLADVAPYTGA